MPMRVIIQSMACVLAGVFFALLLRQPKRTLVFTALIGLNGYLAFQLMGQTMLAYFVSALLIGLLCEITARIQRMATTLFLISAIIPLVPGLGLYRTMTFIARHDYSRALATGLETLAGIGAIALALTLATALFVHIHWPKPQ